MLEYLPVLKLRIFHLTNYRVFFLIDHVHVKDHFNIQCLREIQSHNFKQDPIVTRSESSQRGLMNYSALAELLSIVVRGIVGDGCTYICCLSYWMWVPWVEACLMQDNVKIVSNNLFLYQAMATCKKASSPLSLSLGYLVHYKLQLHLGGSFIKS